MSTIQRNRKIGGTNQFETEFQLGFDDIRAIEVDDDFNTIYNAWNTQVPPALGQADPINLWIGNGANLRPATPTQIVDLSGPDSGTALSFGPASSAIKGRLASRTAGNAALYLNIMQDSTGTIQKDDITKNGWQFRFACEQGGRKGWGNLYSFDSTPDGGASREIMYWEGRGGVSFPNGPILIGRNQNVSPAVATLEVTSASDTRVALTSTVSPIRTHLDHTPGFPYSYFSQNIAWDGATWTRDDSSKLAWRIVLRGNTDEIRFVHTTAAGVEADLMTMRANGTIGVTADPAAALDIATKQYVDSKSGGSSGWTNVSNVISPTDAATISVNNPGNNLSSQYTFGSRSYKARLRTYDHALLWGLNRNDAGTQDDNTKPTWFGLFDLTSDNYTVNRRPPTPPGGSETVLLSLDNMGKLRLGTVLTPKLRAWVNTTRYEAFLGFNIYTNPGEGSFITDDSTRSGWAIRMLIDTTGTDYLHFWRNPVNSATGPPSTIAYFDSSGNFTISGGTATKNTGTTWANPSDRRLKDNIADYETGLAAILQLKPRTFTWNGKGGSQVGVPGQGFIADEVAPVIPEMVGSMRDVLGQGAEYEYTDIQTVDQSNLILALVNAVKELAARVSTLEAKS